MSSYRVTRLIRSAIRLGAAGEVDGIELVPVEPFKPEEGLLVSGDVDADDFRVALDRFNRHLMIVADAITVVTGAVVYPAGGSTLITKKRSKYALLVAVHRRDAARLTLAPGTYGDHLLDAASATATTLASDLQARNAAHYLRQAATTENLTTATHHAVQAAEAWIRSSKQKGESLQKARRRVLGEELDRYFFSREPSLGRSRRTALAHGYRIEEEGLQARSRELQELLLAAFRDTMGVVTVPTFSPVRGFVTFETYTRFLGPVSPPLDLPDLVARVERGAGFHSQSDPPWPGSAVSQRLWRTF